MLAPVVVVVARFVVVLARFVVVVAWFVLVVARFGMVPHGRVERIALGLELPGVERQ